MDSIVLEQLITTLPDEIRIWVSERKPTSSAQAVRLAEDYLQARKSTATGKPELPKRAEKRAMGGQRCHACGELGHFQQDCKKGAKAGSITPAMEAPDRSNKEGVRFSTVGDVNTWR